MGGVIDDATFHPPHLGHPGPGPALAAEAVGLGATGQEGGETGEGLGSQAPGCPRWGAMRSRVWAPWARTCQPLADGRLADAQRLGNRARRPALRLEGPGVAPSSFVPVLHGGFQTGQCPRRVPLG
jgi:hypothetical protein